MCWKAFISPQGPPIYQLETLWYTLSQCLHFNSLFNVLETINMDLFRCIRKDAWENISQYRRQRHFLRQKTWLLSGIWLALLSKDAKHILFWPNLNTVYTLCVSRDSVDIQWWMTCYHRAALATIVFCSDNLMSHVKTLLQCPSWDVLLPFVAMLYLQHQ